MSEIGLAKAQIVDALKASGVDAFAEAPDRSQPNIAVVEPGSPYIEGGAVKTFTGYTIRFNIAILGGTSTSDNGLSQLEDLIEQVVMSLPEGCNLESVEEPGFVTPDTATYHAAVVTVTADFTFNEEVV